MEIIFDNNAGFCFGVKNAVNTVLDLVQKNELNPDGSRAKIFTYGPLIHNRQVIQKLEDSDVYETSDIDAIKDRNALLVIRSHGIPLDKYDYLNINNINYIDCTCPFVSNVHKIVKDYYNKNYRIFIVGDKSHPEVIGINGWCNYSAEIIDDEKIVDKLPNYDKICLVAQTTITKELWDKVVNEVQKKYSDVKICNTICSATEKRQKSAAELSKQVDCMIVIGSYESSNTKKLYEICSKACKNTIHIETAAELPMDKLKKFKKIGITAGASTPDWIIKEVNLKMYDELMENQQNMMEEYEKSFRTLHSGDTVKGTVILVTNDEVMVNIGYKSDGIIKKDDYTWETEQSLKDMVKPGDEIEVKIVAINDGEGNVVLSKKLVDADKNWYKIEYAYNEKAPVDAVVREVVKGGVVAEAFGIRAFVPASQIDLRYTEDLYKFMNTKIKANVVEYDKDKRKVVLSRKDFLKQEKEKKEKEVWGTIAEGQKIVGEVKRLTDFGAFVDLGGVDGLVHISELSWSRIKHPSEVVKPGQKLEVIVLGVDREKGKISLGYKQTMPEPWSTISGKYNVGDIIDVKVVRFADFGAFVQIESGVDGLVHISQISDKRIAKPSDALTIGQTVKAKILEIKPEEKRISLTLKIDEAQEQ